MHISCLCWHAHAMNGGIVGISEYQTASNRGNTEDSNKAGGGVNTAHFFLKAGTIRWLTELTVLGASPLETQRAER